MELFSDNTGETPVALLEAARDRYILYALSVIHARALPDVRDGLKPVQRRILYAMYHNLGLHPSSRYRKSAAVVGEVMAKYHPHGDSAIYEAMVRMAQDFSLLHPLVDGQGNFGCFTGDTRIKLLDGTDRTMDELAQLPPGEIFHVYAVDAAGQIVVGEGRDCRITRRDAELVEVTLDDGATIRCTPDHRFMLRDGSYREACRLTPDDSLMPGYFRVEPVAPKGKPYLQVKQPMDGRYEFVHRIADRFNETMGHTKPIAGAFVRHHKNFNRLDNRPTNIERIAYAEHYRLHADHIRKQWENPQFRAAQRAGVLRYLAAHPECLEFRRQLCIQRNRSSAFRKQNGARISARLKAMFAQDPDLGRAVSRRMRTLWADPAYREKMRAALSGVPRRPLSEEEQVRIAGVISEASRRMWVDPAQRAAITQAITQALSSPEIRAKMSASARSRWNDPEYRGKFAPDHFSKAAQKLWEDPASREQHSKKIQRQRQDPTFVEAQREGVHQSNLRRLRQNPEMMCEMAAASARSLKKKWQDPQYRTQVLRTRILGFTSGLITRFGASTFTPALYEQHRTSGLPKLSNALRYFASFEDLKARSAEYNHRVLSVRPLAEREDVYDITVDKHHNFLLSSGVFVHNSIDGDNAAAMRYTEAKLKPIAEDLLSELDAKTVDYRPTYDGQTFEPVVLPAQLPHVLVNGSEGIAVGMATRIPPHNLQEVVDACLLLLKKPEATLEELCGVIRGPDFPTGGEITSTPGEILAVYREGQGAIRLRAGWTTEQRGRKHFLVLTSLPYGQLKAPLVEKLGEIVAQKRLPQVVDVRDESTAETRVVMELRAGDPVADAEAAMAWLYKHTPLAGSFHLNLTCLVPTDNPEVGSPRRLNLKEVLEYWLQFRTQTVRRRLQYELTQLQGRIHVLEAYEKLFDALDEAIRIIRTSEGKKDASQKLQARFGLDHEQAEAILELKLYRLAKMELLVIQEELAEKRMMAKSIEATLASAIQLNGVIRSELRAIRRQHGMDRRTLLQARPDPLYNEQAYIVAEDTFLICTRDGWVKRQTSITSVDKVRVRDGDAILWVQRCSTVAPILFVTDQGAAYVLRADSVSATAGHGEPVQRHFSFSDRESVVAALPLDARGLPQVGPQERDQPRSEGEAERDPAEAGPWIVAITRQGRAIRTPLLAHRELSTKNGRRLMKLEEGDALLAAYISDGTEHCCLATRDGYALCFPAAEISVSRGAAKGVGAMELREGDAIQAFALSSSPEVGLSIRLTPEGAPETICPAKHGGARMNKGKRLIRKGVLPPWERAMEIRMSFEEAGS